MKKLFAILAVLSVFTTSAHAFVEKPDSTLLYRGIELHDSGDYTAANELLKAYVSQTGTHPEDMEKKLMAHFYLGLVERQIGSIELSTRWFRTIIMFSTHLDDVKRQKYWNAVANEQIELNEDIVINAQNLEHRRVKFIKFHAVIFLVLFLFSLVVIFVLLHFRKKLLDAQKQLADNADLILENSDIVISGGTDLEKNIIDYFSSTKCYLRDDCTLDKLCEDLGVNRTYASAAIGKLAPNFHTLVNRMRIAYAIDLIHEDPTAKLDSIATDCGFNNVRTFYNAFKATTGLTPTEYKKSKGL